MRDASGNLVEVRVREPWALHLLTADGTNAAAKDSETMKAPPEPGLVQLTPTGIEMLLENYVRWDVQKKYTSYFGALPRPFIDALNEYSPSSIPVARAINTTPLVTMSGNIIDGVGLDRDTGLVHRIDPLLRSCLPVDPPSDQDVRDALNFLFDEWLTDVALDAVGKCVAVMLALTLIERALLPERPAFFVTARATRRWQDNPRAHDRVGSIGAESRRCRLVQKPRGAAERRCFPTCVRVLRFLPGTTSHEDQHSVALTSRLRSRRPKYQIGCWEFPA